MSFRIAIALLVCASLCRIASPDELAPEALVAALDDDAFAVRQRAMASLLRLGEVAIPKLEALGGAISLEQRARVAEILGELYRRRLERGFGELGKCPDRELDVERGMILIAQILDPEVTADSILDQLDEMAESVRRSLGEGVDPKTLGGAEAVEAITAVLRDQYRLKGDDETYDHPDNSSIHRVLEQGDGLPIMLSEIAIAVGKRLGVPLVGIGVPKRYMFMYDGSRAPAGRAKDNIIVDPFGGWALKKRGEISSRHGCIDPLRPPLPSLPRETLSRMLRNMGSDFLSVGERRKCETLLRYEALVGGSDVAGASSLAESRSWRAGELPAAALTGEGVSLLAGLPIAGALLPEDGRSNDSDVARTAATARGIGGADAAEAERGDALVAAAETFDLEGPTGSHDVAAFAVGGGLAVLHI